MLHKIHKRLQKIIARPNRELLGQLIRMKFKVNDHNSFLGVLWSLLGPVTLLIVMYMLFQVRFGQDVQAYPLYILIGIVCVNYFLGATTHMTKVFSIHRNLLLNSVLPRENIVIADLFFHTYKFAIEIGLCLILGLVWGDVSWFSFLLIVPLMAAYVAFVCGVSLILSLLYGMARDVEHIWMILSRLFYFVTPVFYTLESISQFARTVVLQVNPLTAFVLSFRGLLLEGGFAGGFTYTCSLLLGAGALACGYWVFMCFEDFIVEHA